MSKIKVVLFMGGDSGEYEVSIASAAQVKKHLSSEKFEVFPGQIKVTVIREKRAVNIAR